MPKKYKMVRKRTRRTQGGSMWNKFLSVAKKLLKGSRAISTIGNIYGATGLPLSGIASAVGQEAFRRGYGRRKTRRGGALKSAGAGSCGGALRYAGASRRCGRGSLTMA